MKITVDVPEELVREVKLKALLQRRKVKDLIAEALSKSLDKPELQDRRRGAIVKSRPNGLPIVHGARSAQGKTISLKEALALEEQATINEDLKRAGFSH
jgi:hypothetical protein